MKTRHTALWIAIAGVIASVANAQDDYGFEDESAPAPKVEYRNAIELGAGYTEDGNGKFGEYTTGVTDALQEEGGFPVGSLLLSGGDAGTATRWEVAAGTGNGRGLEATWSVQGSYGLSLYADRVEKTEYGEAGTVYWDIGQTNLLPPGYVPGTSASDPAFYVTEDIRSERQLFGLEGFRQVGDAWKLTLGFENQEKTGYDVFGGNQGFSGTALVPEELDGEHQQLRARVDYGDRRLQGGLELYLSSFSNGNESLAWDNAVVAGSTVGGVFRPLGIEQIATEPDNEYLRVGLDGGYTFGAMTRLSWYLDWSRGEQDEDFLPVVLDTGYYPSVNPVFPYDSLDGEVERTNLKVTLAGRPFARFDYRAQLAYKGRDATHDPLQVAELSYNYNSITPGFSSRVYDKQTQELSLEAGYRFDGRVRLRGGIGREEMDRDTDEWEYDSVALAYSPLAFTDSTEEDGIWAELSIATLDPLTVKLRAERNVIEADLSDETAEFISPGGVGRRATPAFLLDRDQDVVGVEADVELGAGASFYAGFDLVQDEYDNDTYGLDGRDSTVWSAGFSWAASQALNVAAYTSFEEYEISQIGRQMGATAVPFADWGLDTEDEVLSWGLSVSWAAIEDRLDINAELVSQNADSSYSSSVISNSLPPVPPTSYPSPYVGDTPDVSDDLLRFDLSGVYHWNDRIDVTARYVYENRDAEDWGWTDDINALTAVAPTPQPASARYIAFAWQRPDYSSQLVMMSVRYRF